MLQVLQPLEVTNCDASCIAQDIRQKLNTFLPQNLLSFHCCWTVGSLNNQFGLEFVSVVFVDGFFKGGWDEEINRPIDCRVIKESLRTWVTFNRFVFIFFLILKKLIRVDSILIPDATVPFSDSNEFGPCLNKEFRSPVSDITETLDAEAFAGEALLDAKNSADFRIVENLSGSVENTESS